LTSLSFESLFVFVLDVLVF
uniref:Uncharacterized protein n=1 Tax=Amphimedon queenslandica TaxID=400682 RepID=A0A1X7SXL2_AMPQE